MIFPCSSCGACCRRVDKAVEVIRMAEHGSVNPNNELHFPYTWDENGKCENLTEDNKCSVYENRPTMCNIDKLQSFFGIDKTHFYKANIEACNKMMENDNIDKKYRI